MACHNASRGPPIRIARGSNASTIPVCSVVAFGERPVGPDPGVVIDVAGLGEADDRVQEKSTVNGRRGALRQLLVDSMKRIACLERDHVARSGLLESGPALCGSEAQVAEVEVLREVEHS